MNGFDAKYRLVGEHVRGLDGVLLDIGARDRVLASFLPAALRYVSADMIPGHDYQIDLEKPLPFADGEFDVVVALDVLEHLEHPHRGLAELARIAKSKLFVSLPNMASLSFRLNFFRTGHLSDKYRLAENHQGDRHRWVTTYDQSYAFVRENCRRLGRSVVAYDIPEDPTSWGKLRFLLPPAFVSPAARTYTMLFEIGRT